jgi:hypothetical protein
VVEMPHRHREHGRPVHVRIELSLPGEDITHLRRAPWLTSGCVLDRRERGVVKQAVGGQKPLVAK